MPYLHPVYKLLAHNDTPGARGHQAGPLIPKEIETYFPVLPSTTATGNPTVDVSIEAALFLGAHYLGQVTTRYQHQTWDGSRAPERRLTGNLTTLLMHAKRDDLLLFERDDAVGTRYRLTLHTAGTPAHADVVARHPGKRWGTV